MLRLPARVDPACLTLLLFAYLGLALLFERHAGHAGELVLGGVTWLALLIAARSLQRTIRARVAAVVVVASAGEVLGSIVLELYSYRRGGIPLFVPPGHGLIYLAGHHLACSALLRRRPAWTIGAAAAAAGAWATYGLLLAPWPDVAGALVMPALLVFLWRGRDPVLFAAMLAVVAVLELYGTWMGSWTWTAVWPGTGLRAGNPPSGVAAGYCVFDALALWLGPRLLRCREAVARRRRTTAATHPLAPRPAARPAH
jgi:hypothetical protein